MIPCVHGCGQTFETAAFAKRHVKFCRKGPHARMLNRTLDCAYCQPESVEFKNFKELAEHVLRWHVHSWAPSATQEDVNILFRQQLDAESKQLSKGATVPLPQPEAGQYNDWFTPDCLNGNSKATIQILGVREATRQMASDVLVDISYSGTKYTWGLKADSVNYARLHKRFGSTESKWKGKVSVETVTKGKRTYVNVSG